MYIIIIIIIIIINKSGNVIFFCGTGRHTDDACMCEKQLDGSSLLAKKQTKTKKALSSHCYWC